MNLVLTRRREGGQNLENLADVICACPLRGPPIPLTLLGGWITKMENRLHQSHPMKPTFSMLIRVNELFLTFKSCRLSHRKEWELLQLDHLKGRVFNSGKAAVIG